MIEIDWWRMGNGGGCEMQSFHWNWGKPKYWGIGVVLHPRAVIGKDVIRFVVNKAWFCN